MKKLLLFSPQKLIFWIFLSSLLARCTPIPPNHQSTFRNQVLKTAEVQNFKRGFFQTPFFTLTIFSHITQPLCSQLIIYLEGDGNSYESPYRLSQDPTPHHPLALQLALKDPRPNIVYIARPGQYPSPDARPCDPQYWSTHRFSQEVIDATNQAIDFSKYQSQAQTIQLIGFS